MGALAVTYPYDAFPSARVGLGNQEVPKYRVGHLVKNQDGVDGGLGFIPSLYSQIIFS